MKRLISLALICILSSPFIYAADKKDGNPVSDSLKREKTIARIDSIIKSIQFVTGEVTIGNNLAKINVPDGFVFLNSTDAQKVLTDLWNNPNDPDVLGLLMPKGESAISDSAWAIIYTYEEDGHVKDDDANDINYDDLLTQMKKKTDDNNAERIKQGFSPFHLVGWAQKPFYDKKNHKLHWAKELSFENDSAHTLNYNIRMLGRKGVLVMNAVASIQDLKKVENNLDKIMASTNFTKGNTYEEYTEGVDKVAEYGLGGLIAGGILLKTGLLAKLGLLLASTWKFIVAGFVALFAFLRRKIFGGGARNE